MITIGICDNDPVFCDHLYDMICHSMIGVDDWDIGIFHNGAGMKRAIDNGTFQCQLVFMDVLLDGETGLETAKYICDHCSYTDLIFVTASDKHVYECFYYHAFAYLLKPVSEEDIARELQRYLQKLNHSSQYLLITYKGVTHQIPIHSILYIESNLRKIAIHTQQATYYCYQKLNVMAEKLKNRGFVRCHQSYLFALDKVTNYSNVHVYIQDVQLPISSRYQAKVQELLDRTGIRGNEQFHVPRAGLNEEQTDCGALICIRGAYLGSIIRICPEQEIMIGRDGSVADMIINLPLVSRCHCTLIYHCGIMRYEVMDRSSNGTFVDGNKRLLKNETYLLKPGSEICFGDKETVYKLG